MRVVLTSNKVGHDFPTGPLDIIQSWVELEVTDDAGQRRLLLGRRDEKNFLEPGTFLFKVEPVDQYGNLIDRHNLWEMVGVRFRRALFPATPTPSSTSWAAPRTSPRWTHEADARPEVGTPGYDVPTTTGAKHLPHRGPLQYRKVDQFLINYMFGEDSGITRRRSRSDTRPRPSRSSSRRGAGAWRGRLKPVTHPGNGWAGAAGVDWT